MGGISEVDMMVRIVEIRKRKVVRRSMSLLVVDFVVGSVVLGGFKGLLLLVVLSDGCDNKNGFIMLFCLFFCGKILLLSI